MQCARKHGPAPRRKARWGLYQTAPGGSRKTRPRPWTAPECFRPPRPSVPARRTWPVSPWAACRMPSAWMRAPPCIPIHPTGILIARIPAPIRFFLRQRRPQGLPIPHTAPICPVPPPWPDGPHPRYGAGSQWPRHSAQTAPWGRPEMHPPWDNGNPALAQAGYPSVPVPPAAAPPSACRPPEMRHRRWARPSSYTAAGPAPAPCP